MLTDKGVITVHALSSWDTVMQCSKQTRWQQMKERSLQP